MAPEPADLPPARRQELKSLAQRLEYRFQNLGLLDQALRHSRARTLALMDAWCAALPGLRVPRGDGHHRPKSVACWGSASSPAAARACGCASR